MSLFIKSITELSQNFLHADPITFNQYFTITPDYQKYCLNATLPIRFTITLAKEAMLIHDIAIHLLAAGCKLTIGTVKGLCSIPFSMLNLEIDPQTPSKQAAVHFGFTLLYILDMFVSITNINQQYPQHLMDKINNVFIHFLEDPKKKMAIQYVTNPEIEKVLQNKQTEIIEKELALQTEQRKAKEQAELFKKMQQELEALRDSDFFSEEDLQEIFKGAQEVIATTTYQETPIKEEPLEMTTYPSMDHKLCTDPSQYMLTYPHLIESDEDTNLSIQEETPDFWFEDEFDKDKTLKKKLPSQKNKSFSHNNFLPTSSLARRLQYDKERRKNCSKRTLTK